MKINRNLKTLVLAATLLVPAQSAQAGWFNDSVKSTKKFINKHPWASALMATATVGGIGYGLYNWYTQPETDDTEYYVVPVDQTANPNLYSKEKKQLIDSHQTIIKKRAENLTEEELLEELEVTKLPESQQYSPRERNRQAGTPEPSDDLIETEKKELIDNHQNILKQRTDNLTEEELLEELEVPEIVTIASEVIDKLNELLELPLTQRAQRSVNRQLKEWESYQDHTVVISLANLKAKKDVTLDRIAKIQSYSLAAFDKDCGIVELGSDDIANLKQFETHELSNEEALRISYKKLNKIKSKAIDLINELLQEDIYIDSHTKFLIEKGALVWWKKCFLVSSTDLCGGLLHSDVIPLESLDQKFQELVEIIVDIRDVAQRNKTGLLSKHVVFETVDRYPAPENPEIELVETYVPEWSDSDSDDELKTSQELGQSMLFDVTKSFMETEKTAGKRFKAPEQTAMPLEDYLEQITPASFAETLAESTKETYKRIKGAVSDDDIASEQSAIARGGAYAYQILIKNNFDAIPTKTILEYQKAITDLQSFFYSLSFQKRFDGLGFVEGTFFIEDPTGSLKKFLEGYLTTVQNAGYDIGSPDANHLIAKNPFAYYRANSHHFADSFGVDRRLEDGSISYWMDKFGHILIGFNSKGVWFKPEKSGCGLSEVPSHALHLLEAQTSKQTKKLIDGIEYLTNYKLIEMEGDDSPLNNKERTPTEVIKSFMQLFPEAKAETGGINRMYAYANNQLSTNRVKPEQVDAVQEFVSSLKQSYSKVGERQGSELYISQEDMLFAWGHAANNDKTTSNFVSSIFAPLAYELSLYRAQSKFHIELDKNIKTSLAANLREAIEHLITAAPVVVKKLTDETMQNYLKQTLAICKHLIKLTDAELLHEIENNSILETGYQAEKIRKLLAHSLADILTQFEQDALALFNQFASIPEQEGQKIQNHNKVAKKAAKALRETIHEFTTRGLTQFQDGKITPATMGTSFTLQAIDYADTIGKDQLQKFLETCKKVETLWGTTSKGLISAAGDYGMFTNESSAIEKINLSYIAKIKTYMNTINRAWSDKVSDVGTEYLQRNIQTETESAEDAVRNLVATKNQAEQELYKAFDNDFIEPFSMLWFFAPTVALYHAKLEQNFTTTKRSIDDAYAGAKSIVDMNVPEKSDYPRHVAYRNFQAKYQELNRQLAAAKQQNQNK